MSIPKIIHYCWFGGGAISPENRKCMESWKKYCPDYKIIEWNEQNFDISKNRYVQQAYETKKYAFVSDYARLAVLYASTAASIWIRTWSWCARWTNCWSIRVLSAWSTVCQHPTAARCW